MATASGLLLGPADHGRRLTFEEFYHADVVEGYRYELARGVVEVTYVPNPPHGMIVHAFYLALADYERQHPGVIYRFGGAGEFRLWLPALISGRNPDVAVVLEGAPRDGRRRRNPALVMEVVSAGSEAGERDYVTKREEYLAYGLNEYWIVDPIARRVLVLNRFGDTWEERASVAGQEASSLVLPDFRVAVAELWSAYDRAVADEGEGEGDEGDEVEG